jgi:phosphate transport system permease protein
MFDRSSTRQDQLFTLALRAVALATVLVFAAILGDLLWQGMAKMSWAFLVSEPENAGRNGGIASILVSTLLILAVAMMVAIPMGLGCAIWLSEFVNPSGHWGRGVRLSLDVLAGVPSIVFGLFGNAFFCQTLGLGFSIVAGGLTLACMMLPIFIRTAESGLSSVPQEWRHGAAALGMSRSALLWQVLLPAAAPTILAGLILSIGRATAETAALIFTSGYVDRMPSSLLDSGRALSVHIFDLSMNVTGGDPSAYASALVLICVVLAINALALSLFDLWRGRAGSAQPSPAS